MPRRRLEGEKTRLARYRNVPELLTMFRVFADVKTA